MHAAGEYERRPRARTHRQKNYLPSREIKRGSTASSAPSVKAWRSVQSPKIIVCFSRAFSQPAVSSPKQLAARVHSKQLQTDGETVGNRLVPVTSLRLPPTPKNENVDDKVEEPSRAEGWKLVCVNYWILKIKKRKKSVMRGAYRACAVRLGGPPALAELKWSNVGKDAEVHLSSTWGLST